MTESFFHAATPVFAVDGEDVGELARDLVRLEVSDSLDGLKALRARFVAIGPSPGIKHETLLYLDGRHVDFGRSLAVSLGPPSNRRQIFDGVVSALEIEFEEGEEPEFCLAAEDRLMELRMTRRSKTYENLSDADIAAEIALAHGLSADVDIEGPVYDRVQQLNMSDLAFLRDRARLLQADIALEGDTLSLKTRERRGSSDVTLIRGTDLISVHARADLAHQRSAVRVSGYDARERAVIDEIAGAEVVDAEVTAGRTGVSVLAGAFGERVSHRVREVPLEASEASEWARAEMLRRARAFVRIDALSRGTPELAVGSSLVLEQMGTPFDGAGYYVTRVQHTFDLNDGHRTCFEAERATIGEGG